MSSLLLTCVYMCLRSLHKKELDLFSFFLEYKIWLGLVFTKCVNYVWFHVKNQVNASTYWKAKKKRIKISNTKNSKRIGTTWQTLQCISICFFLSFKSHKYACKIFFLAVLSILKTNDKTAYQITKTFIPIYLLMTAIDLHLMFKWFFFSLKKYDECSIKFMLNSNKTTFPLIILFMCIAYKMIFTIMWLSQSQPLFFITFLITMYI